MHERIVHVGDVLLRIDAGWSPLCNERMPHPGEWGVLKVSAITTGNYRPSESKSLAPGLNPRPDIEVHPGDIIMCRANGLKELVGVSAIVFDTPSRLMLSDKTLRLVLNPALVDPRYLNYFLSSHMAKSQIARMTSGSSGQNNISQRFIKSMKMNLPPLARQQKVASILDDLDKGISASRRIASEKLPAIRQGTLDQLTGDAWKSAPRYRMADISTNDGDYGSNSSAIDYNPSLPRYIRITDIADDGSLRKDSMVSISNTAAVPHMLRKRDLLIARTGFTTGKSYLYKPEDGKCAFAGYLVRFSIDSTKAIPEYIFYWTQSESFARWVGQNIHEVGQRNISAKEYAGHMLAVPSLEIQRKIVNEIQAIDATINQERAIASKLHDMKQGLMTDLLTGRARI